MALYAGVRWLVKGDEGRIAALLFAVIFLFSPTALTAATAIAAHIVFASIALGATILAGKWMQTGDRRYWYAAVAASAAATCTLEVGLGFIPVFAACCWFQRRSFQGWTLGRLLGFAGRSAAIWVAAMTVIWPPALFKLSLLKSCVYVAYMATRPTAFGGTNFLQGWRQRFMTSPLEWLVAAAGIVIAIALYRRRKSLPPAALPVLTFGVVMLVAMLRVSANTPKYTMVYLPALELFGCMMLAHISMRVRPGFRYGIAALVCAGALAVCVWRVGPQRGQMNSWDLDSQRMIEFVKAQRLGTGRILAGQDLVPTLHFYFPGITWRGYRDSEDFARLAASRRFDGALTTEPVFKYTVLDGR